MIEVAPVDLARVEIPAPSIATQRKVVDVLDRYEHEGRSRFAVDIDRIVVLLEGEKQGTSAQSRAIQSRSAFLNAVCASQILEKQAVKCGGAPVPVHSRHHQRLRGVGFKWN